jgi:hypothetical protein
MASPRGGVLCLPVRLCARSREGRECASGSASRCAHAAAGGAHARLAASGLRGPRVRGSDGGTSRRWTIRRALVKHRTNRARATGTSSGRVPQRSDDLDRTARRPAERRCLPPSNFDKPWFGLLQSILYLATGEAPRCLPRCPHRASASILPTRARVPSSSPYPAGRSKPALRPPIS